MAVKGFDDRAAELTMMEKGITSAWVRNTPPPHPPTCGATFQAAHEALSQRALDDHVNNFGRVRHTTPYVSLTAGAVVPDGAGSSRPVGAWTTAANFATGGGQVDGYIFECWVLVGPKPAPELPGFAEAVRDLNASAQFSLWHEEGEIAAKLVVPPRQIRRMVKLRPITRPAQKKAPESCGLAVVWVRLNPDFVEPERVTNLIPLVG
jgi:hypothetical protein